MIVSLQRLLVSAGYKYDRPDVQISGICYSSSDAAESYIFFAIVGVNSDGHNYVADAYEKGVRVFFVSHSISLPDDAIIITVSDTRIALADISAAFYGHPQNKLITIGVTGTKGKSTVVEFIRRILNCSGRKCASVGTLGFDCEGEHIDTVNSTPQSADLFGYLSKMVDRSVEYAVIEASSQGIRQNRIRGIHFDYAIFTILSADHIGQNEHSSFADYKSSKIDLLKVCDTALINADDGSCSEFAIAPRNIYYSINTDADLSAGNIVTAHTDSGFTTECDISVHGKKHAISLSIPGYSAVYDMLAAAAVCMDIGVDIETIKKAVKDITVPGRFEFVRTDSGIDCVIDYAHNGASMVNALITLKQCGYDKVIAVFGSVGGRSQIRRKELGDAVEKYADFAVITSDNPDREDAQIICEEIAEYIQTKPYRIITDRVKAIDYAVSMAEKGDVVLLAGKGHECYQLVNGVKYPFNEREFVLN
ncbi:MAG: UDP-N-acetylmuramoyl-L-alanyl-D-glutamate--2,6-diaminopimelate ligase [Clostridia bacterium]|nr:UDP-N-acetylmuramoyl-L-alanyl-D-glutamate--2,6-diaminopimelate ligase [Clostridia bacterium]